MNVIAVILDPFLVNKAEDFHGFFANVGEYPVVS